MNGNLQGKRILICEEALIDYKGHFYSWIKAIRKIHIEAGAEVLVACNRNVSEEIKKEFNAFPIYSHNNWSGIYNYKQAWKRYLSVFKHNFYVWKETRALLLKLGSVDCIILPAVRIHQIIAWRELCRKCLGRNFNRVILFLLTSEAIYDESFSKFHFKRTSNLMRAMLRSFRKHVAGGNVILAGDSHITSHEYETLSGVPFRVFPSPGAGLQAINNSSSLEFDRNEHTTFVILGVSFIDKGIDLLQKAILFLINEDPSLPARFIIQWATEMIDYEGSLVQISEQLRKAQQVQLIEHILDEKSYQHYIHQADFVILPYRLKVYFNRISGVAVEAACAGIPMIVTENSWLEWAMDKFGAGVTFKDGDYKDLAQKILKCISEKELFQERAKDRRTTALEINSSSHYLECVWK